MQPVRPRRWPPLILLGLAGCADPPQGFDSPVPAARLDAITKAAEHHDESAIPDLITMLESDDPVVRMAAIRTLQLLTGQTLGYDYAAPEWERRDKVEAWNRWYQDRHPGAQPPRGGTGGGQGGGQGGGAETTDSGGASKP